jgi:NAD+ diphosphatase
MNDASNSSRPAPIVFTGNPLDRASNLRRDSAWLAAALQDGKSRFLPLYQLKVLIAFDPEPRLDWRPAADVGDLIATGATVVMLGLDGDACRFAIDASTVPDGRREGWGKFIDVRSMASQVSAEEAGILAQARSLIDWHARHGFCAVCGNATLPQEGGYSRLCGNAACKAQHFPRTDPVVIMLVLRGDQCLLGRQPQFPRGMYSALAGFIEPGETIENAVRREIMEEAGIAVGRVRYHASQPWPFPASLMLGFHAEAKTTAITVDKSELDDARWYEKAWILAHQDDEQFRLPRRDSIARRLVEDWLYDRVERGTS